MTVPDLRHVVVDTNVIVAAHVGAERIPACGKLCARELARVREEDVCVVLDDGWQIYREYRRNVPEHGHPTPGRVFMKWVFTNLRNPRRCQQVRITPDPDRGYAEFPAGDGLEAFDPSDRKFVAVANAHPGRPPILQATDSKWIGWEGALARAGIRVEFLCRGELEQVYRKKFPASGV